MADIDQRIHLTRGSALVSPVPVYILAGGRSSRFGSDKARAILDGKPLIVRVADMLRPVASSITAVADAPGKYDDLGLPTIADLSPGRGPLGGLHAALSHLPDQHAWLLAVSCDLVVVRPHWIEPLLAVAAPPARAVAFRHDHWEPLLALYHRDLLPVVQRRLDAGRLALMGLLDEAQATPLPLPDDWPATVQANTKADLDRAARGPSG